MTTRWLVVAAALAALALTGYVLPWGGDLLLLGNGAWLAALALDRLRAPEAMDFEIDLQAPSALSVGRAALVEYHWRSRSRRARLMVRENRPARLGGLQPPTLITVPPEGYVHRVEVTPRRRGRAAEGGLVVRALGPWGLAWRQWRVRLPWAATVLPSRAVSRLAPSVAWTLRRREHGQRATRRRGQGRLFESLREWVPGDDVRHVDWKATGRRRKVITRQYEEERRQHLVLAIDAGRLMTADLGSGSRLDAAVGAAVELAYAAIEQDDDIGVMIFADGVRRYVPPQRRRRGLEAVLTALAEAEASLVEPDYPGAFRYLAARNRRRALSVVFTDVIDRFASEALVTHVGALRPRHMVLTVALRDPALDAVAHDRAESAAAAYRKAAANALLAAREEGLGAMRAAGVLVVDATPAGAARAVVRSYRELKRRGQL